MKQIIVSVAMLLLGLCTYAQQRVQGVVIEETADGKRMALGGALVGIIGTTNANVTNEKGEFVLDSVNIQTAKLRISALGYNTDTLPLNGNKIITISLKPSQLAEVEITERKVTRLELSAMNVEVITEADLVKDACCNLSESFENTTTVDVSYSDAVSGAKEIRMLGLDGVYSQIMVENIPSIRSLGNAFGMNYISGPWMSSIQVNKGAGSVVNGYESMTGQINIELKKPDKAEKLFVNFFANQDARAELNIITAHKFNEKWSYLGAVHGQYNWLKMDMNKDGYIDNPLIKNLNVFNRVSYASGKMFGFVGGVTVNIEDRMGGQMMFMPKHDTKHQDYWGLRLGTQRVEAFAKTAFNLSEDNFIGIQYKYMYHNQSGYIGKRNYRGNEHFGYFNAIFQHLISPEHTLKVGISALIDNVEETFDTINRKRTEVVPGVFTEGTFNFGKDDAVTVVVGGRADYHNMYGPILTPRVNVKWRIVYGLSLRLSAGKGYRVPTVFAENFGWLANSRAINIAPDLKMEEAWNYGASLSYKFNIGFRPGAINVDFYRSDFVNQVVVDLEDVRQLQFYNLDGRSFANCAQIEVGYELFKGFEAKIAYKYEQTKTDYKEGRKIYPLRPQHRGLVSLGYVTKNKMWRFNSSLNWFGKTRIPDTSLNDEANRRSTQSKDWFQLNAQITFKWKAWEFYVGGENLINFIQQNPIIAGDQPFSNQYDASLIWGPLRGAMAFTGFRFVLNK